LREGGYDGDVVVTGNTVIDALTVTAESATVPAGTALATHEGPILLVTAHRRESWGAPMRAIAEGLRTLSQRRPDLLIVIPVHRNPTVRAALGPVLENLPGVELLEPLEYPAFVAAMARSTIILTDSGGVQEEAPSLGKPVLVMRATTERTEGIDAGTVRLIGTDRHRIVEEVERLLDDPAHYAAMAEAHNPYGDGRATERSVAALRRFLGDDDVVVEEFSPG
jgi:UDP-N-acetylglucosamine 2-epimerase (non-hydrolysing)